MLERDIVTAIKKFLSSLGSDVFFWKEHGGPVRPDRALSKVN